MTPMRGEMAVKVMLAVAIFAVMIPSGASAERAKSPADATVFVRLVGSVHAEVEENGVKRTEDLARVEIGTGSGFVISPFGYVLTNDHVVSNSELIVTRGAKKAKLTLKVLRIEVCFPAGVAAARGLSSPCAEASVAASDPTLDLAVLLISAANLPYVALGDSDVVTAGLPVDALGYPFGRELEVGKVVTAPDLVPEISTTSGTISAMRDSDAGERRYLQVTNTVNPGNSGGPLVDRDGFAVGVIRMKLATAEGIAFAIPVNEVKDFLESHSLGHLMPVPRRRLGPFQSLEGKGIGLRVPEGLADTSPFRSRVETDAKSVEVALRIDRVFSPWNPKQLEQAIVSTQAFEQISAADGKSEISSQPGEAPLLLGHASGTAADSKQEIRIDYAVLDLGAEKLVARYIGPAEAIAFNESALRESLASLEGQRFLVGELGPVEELEWSGAVAANGEPVVPMPFGWVLEPSGPGACPGLPPPDTVGAAFPSQDFTVALRTAVWVNGDIVPDQAAAACSSGRGSSGRAAYASRGEWLGVSYYIEGVFIRTGHSQVIQLEVLSPDQKSPFARRLLAAWIKKATE
jgi:S1-C subfamily serine protease